MFCICLWIMACGPVILCSIMLCCLKAGIPCKLSPEAWLKDLAGTKPLSVLAKKVCVIVKFAWHMSTGLICLMLIG